MPPLLKRDLRLGEGVNLLRWAVVKRIGDGGFAEVYEVTDTFKDDEKARLFIFWAVLLIYCCLLVA